ncbi:MAG TPA: hypothetical protein VEZ20_05405 [Allosphingosinicella sp.]|nr:hypothetical protein [Allosphingosinicella sp.]
MTAKAGELNSQNEMVVTFTLVELLTTLVFIAMALALILKNEALRDLSPSQERMKALTERVEQQRLAIARMEDRIALLEREVAEKNDVIRRLMADRSAPLPPGGTIVTQRHLDELRGDAAISRERAETIRGLAEQIRALRGGATVTLPRCPTNVGDLLTVRLHGDGSLSAKAAWGSEFNARVARVPGVGALASGRTMSRGQFGQLADQAARWGMGQSPQCRFRVSIESLHGNMATYRRQRATVWERFYVTRDR